MPVGITLVLLLSWLQVAVNRRLSPDQAAPLSLRLAGSPLAQTVCTVSRQATGELPLASWCNLSCYVGTRLAAHCATLASPPAGAHALEVLCAVAQRPLRESGEGWDNAAKRTMP